MYPPPTISKVLGIWLRDNAPVEVIKFFSSISTNGIFADFEPVAIIIYLDCIFFSPFSDLTKILFLSIKEASPLICVILFF